jgi:hypothetical protein
VHCRWLVDCSQSTLLPKYCGAHGDLELTLCLSYVAAYLSFPPDSFPILRFLSAYVGTLRVHTVEWNAYQMPLIPRL